MDPYATDESTDEEDDRVSSIRRRRAAAPQVTDSSPNTSDKTATSWKSVKSDGDLQRHDIDGPPKEPMQIKFLRRVKSVKDGFSSSLHSIRKGTRNAAAATENPLGDYPSPFGGKILLVLAFPFVPVVLYFLYTLFTNLIWFGYLVFIFNYVAVLVAFGITEIAIRPPWYHPQPKEKGLFMHDVPSYWQGIFTNPEHDLGLAYENVDFTSWNNLTLRGWYVPTAAPTPIALALVHGGGHDRRAWLRHVGFFHKEGYACLLFDMSGHGNSDGPGRGFSYGVKESLDVIAAVKWLKEVRKHKVVVVVGTSVGGASVITAAARDPTIDGVIAENPVAEPSEFAIDHLKKMVSRYNLPAPISRIVLPLFYRLVVFVFLFRIGAIWNYKAPVELAPFIAPRPFLLMHGTADDTVPEKHSHNLFAAAKEPKELWLAKEAWHCALIDKYPSEFKARIRGYFAKHFPTSAIAAPKEDEKNPDVPTPTTSATAL